MIEITSRDARKEFLREAVIVTGSFLQRLESCGENSGMPGKRQKTLILGKHIFESEESGARTVVRALVECLRGLHARAR